MRIVVKPVRRMMKGSVDCYAVRQCVNPKPVPCSQPVPNLFPEQVRNLFPTGGHTTVGGAPPGTRSCSGKMGSRPNVFPEQVRAGRLGQHGNLETNGQRQNANAGTRRHPDGHMHHYRLPLPGSTGARAVKANVATNGQTDGANRANGATPRPYLLHLRRARRLDPRQRQKLRYVTFASNREGVHTAAILSAVLRDCACNCRKPTKTST
jgi:hypothetical protein